MTTQQPTPDDMARDAAADLAVCAVATLGPWRFQWQSSDAGHKIMGPPGSEGYVGRVWTTPDGEFVALARTALPAWIRRAQAAEEENARLQERYDNIAVLASECAISAAETGLNTSALHLEIHHLKAQNAHLRAVIEGHMACADAEIIRLKDAFAREGNEIEQTLGKALGYPPSYPDVSPVDDGQVCVGEHVPVTLALEAAKEIARLRARVAALEAR